MGTNNKLYWKTATEPTENIEVRLILNCYTDNDNLYIGLETPSDENREYWEPYTDLTVNFNSLPPFHAYVDSRDYNKYAHEFLVLNRIAEPTELEYNGFRIFRFNPERLKELAPEQFKNISKKLPPQKHMTEEIIYGEERFPLRTVADNCGIYKVSTDKFEEALVEGARNLDGTAIELLDKISLFCPVQEFQYLTDEELIETINGQ